MTKLRRVYYNGVYVVAELKEDIPSGRVFYSDDIFVLNAKDLKERIKNRKSYGLDVTEDQEALRLIESHKEYKP
jgi:hypothetical protein